jgi:cytochrome c-type biogenesis protein CcmE
MNSHHQYRMAWVLILLLASGAVVGLVLYALKQNINLFYTPTQIASQEAPMGVRIRVGGMVDKGSVKREDRTGTQTVAVQFTLSDLAHSLTVHYNGILPDLFREGQGIVVMGKLGREGTLLAEEVLAKHDEKYMPIEMAGTMDKFKH